MTLELGLDTFGDVGGAQSHAEALRNLVEQGVLADRVGVDFLGVGEHHRADFAVSAPKGRWRPSPRAPSASGSARR